MKFDNLALFGTPLYVSPLEYQAREVENVGQRVGAWRQLDTSSIHPIYAALEKESGSPFRTTLSAFRKKNKLYTYIEKCFSKRCAEVSRGVFPNVHVEKKRLSGNSTACCHYIGLRHAMEDAHVFGKVRLSKEVVPFFALCDGHAGDGAALFLKENLKEIIEYVFARSVRLDDSVIENALMMVGVLATERLAAVRDSEQAKTVYALMNEVGLKYEALRTIQDEKEIKELSTKMYEASKSMPYALGGTTFVLALVIDSVLWVANVGDSRGIVVTPTHVLQLTDDASLTKLHFREGVEKRGGSVGPDGNGILRTSGGWGINLARSVGERKELGVSARAKVARFQLTAEPTILVLGCDGLFDVLSTSDVGSLVQKCRLDTASKLSELFVKAAFANGSEDNISAMVVKLLRPPLQHF